MQTESNRVRGILGCVWALRRGIPTAHDPLVALILWALIIAAVAGGLLSLWCSYLLTELLPPFGGLIVVLGAYFAARTLRENEVAQSTLMLAGENDAVRIAGVHRLGTVAAQTPRFRPYVEVTLRAFAGDCANGARPRTLAEAILKELSGLKKNRIADLQTRDV